MAKINIGKIPVMKGEYIHGRSYDRLWQVTCLGSTYQSKIDSNDSVPAIKIKGVISHANTDKWLCIADTTSALNNMTEALSTLDTTIETKVSNMHIDTNGHLIFGN